MITREQLPGWLVAWLDRRVERNTRVRWEPEHQGAAYGRNGFGQRFLLRTARYDPPERRWHLIELNRCPAHRWACTCGDRLLWTGDSIEAGKARADLGW